MTKILIIEDAKDLREDVVEMLALDIKGDSATDNCAISRGTVGQVQSSQCAGRQ